MGCLRFNCWIEIGMIKSLSDRLKYTTKLFIFLISEELCRLSLGYERISELHDRFFCLVILNRIRDILISIISEISRVKLTQKCKALTVASDNIKQSSSLLERNILNILAMTNKFDSLLKFSQSFLIDTITLYEIFFESRRCPLTESSCFSRIGPISDRENNIK